MPSRSPTPVPNDERRRLKALYALNLLDSLPDREFDAAVALAARLLDKPLAAITLVDSDRVWVKASEGLDATEEPRALSFCTWTIADEATLIIPDTTADPRMAVRGEALGHDIRFYAGTPLHAPTGERVGALCVGSGHPDALDEDQQRSLEELAVLVDALIAARATTREAIEIATRSDRQAAQLRRQERALQQAQRMAMIGSWRLQLIDETLEWSDNVYRIHGLPVGGRLVLDTVMQHYPPHARALVADALRRSIEAGTPFDIETDFLTVDRSPRRVRAVGEVERENDRPVAIVGVFQDITERHAVEQSLRMSADRDGLTGIANRSAFNRALGAAMTLSRERGTPLLLALIDLDGFKKVNDTLGHLAGDDALRGLAGRLQQPWLNGTVAARLGGDEFALIVDDPALVGDPAGFVERLQAELCVPVTRSDLTIAVSGSIGVALLSDDMHDLRDLVHAADTMLYAAKRRRVGERRGAERRLSAA